MRKSFLFVISCLVLLAACNDSGNAPAGQVAAKVNGDEITIHQLNFEMQQPRVHTVDPDSARKEALENLVKRQLLVQQAQEAELDRNPRVVQAIERAKRRVLAQAYLQKLSLEAIKPTTSEAEIFAKKHPELFENRRIYNLEQVIVEKGAVTTADLEAKINGGSSFIEIVQWLKEQNAIVRGGRSTKTAETLQPDMLELVKDMTSGEMVLLPGKDQFSVLHLVEAKEQPVPAEAIPKAASEYLLSLRKSQLVADEVKKLVEGAVIDYHGDFSGMNQQVAAIQDAVTPQLPQNHNANAVDITDAEGQNSRDSSLE